MENNLDLNNAFHDTESHEGYNNVDIFLNKIKFGESVEIKNSQVHSAMDAFVMVKSHLLLRTLQNITFYVCIIIVHFPLKCQNL
jgi:hypothetical protein